MNSAAMSKFLTPALTKCIITFMPFLYIVRISYHDVLQMLSSFDEMSYISYVAVTKQQKNN